VKSFLKRPTSVEAVEVPRHYQQILLAEVMEYHCQVTAFLLDLHAQMVTVSGLEMLTGRTGFVEAKIKNNSLIINY